MLVLVRHGQTAVNAAGRIQGRADAPLTALGHAQAAAAARAAGRPALVVSSPLLRARETASHFGAEVVVDERWIELDYGDLDGVALADVDANTWAAWRSDLAFAPPGGESLLAVGARVRDACEDLADRAGDEDVVVVSHVTPIKAAVAWALGVGDGITWRMFLDVAAISRIGFRDGRPLLVSWNDRSHLPA